MSSDFFDDYYFDSAFTTLHINIFLKCFIFPHLFLVTLLAVFFSTCWASCVRIQEASDTHLKAPWELRIPGVCGSGAQFLSVWVGADTSLHTWLERSQVSELQHLSPVPVALGTRRRKEVLQAAECGVRVWQRVQGWGRVGNGEAELGGKWVGRGP